MYTKAPEQPIWQEHKPAPGSMDSPQAQHPLWVHHRHSTPETLLGPPQISTKIHGFTTGTAPLKPCWQELQPALGSMESPQPQHPSSPAGVHLKPALRLRGFTTGTAPLKHCWHHLKPALGSMDSPQPQHPSSPCCHELQPPLGSMDSPQPPHP